jgi:uncharacterized membrane protein YiaA
LKPLTKTLNMKKQNVSTAFVAASWVALGAGMIGFIVGLARAEMQLNEKGYYFTILLIRTVCRGFFAESSA